jgi:hypothetical protein
MDGYDEIGKVFFKTKILLAQIKQLSNVPPFWAVACCLCLPRNVRTGFGHTKRPIKRVLGGFYPVIRQSERDVNHAASSSVVVNNEWSYASTPAIRVERDNCSFTFSSPPPPPFTIGSMVAQAVMLASNCGAACAYFEPQPGHNLC